MPLERLKELWQPIAQGLFGEEGATPARYRVPHYEVRPVGMIVEDLVTIPDELWAKYAFAREPLNGKFNDEQRLELTERAAEQYAQGRVLHLEESIGLGLARLADRLMLERLTHERGIIAIVAAPYLADHIDLRLMNKASALVVVQKLQKGIGRAVAGDKHHLLRDEFLLIFVGTEKRFFGLPAQAIVKRLKQSSAEVHDTFAAGGRRYNERHEGRLIAVSRDTRAHEITGHCIARRGEERQKKHVALR